MRKKVVVGRADCQENVLYECPRSYTTPWYIYLLSGYVPAIFPYSEALHTRFFLTSHELNTILSLSGIVKH